MKHISIMLYNRYIRKCSSRALAVGPENKKAMLGAEADFATPYRLYILLMQLTQAAQAQLRLSEQIRALM
ncbi:hypothetical protein ACN38_g1633 [Penicillium nordicum]|uniref:Uncharacterized protein n=1 Tax=Penicillium nordicum TaxID=229535 RepID=A0A0M8P8P3_9EURO|nr:hypothetical protein ACN38_g1633 [Penicillium nordicum]